MGMPCLKNPFLTWAVHGVYWPCSRSHHSRERHSETKRKSRLYIVGKFNFKITLLNKNNFWLVYVCLIRVGSESVFSNKLLGHYLLFFPMKVEQSLEQTLPHNNKTVLLISRWHSHIIPSTHSMKQQKKIHNNQPSTRYQILKTGHLFHWIVHRNTKVSWQVIQMSICYSFYRVHLIKTGKNRVRTDPPILSEIVLLSDNKWITHSMFKN